MEPHDPPSPAPTLPRFVTASAEEIRLAEELRRQIEQRYLGRSDLADPFWSTGAD